MTRIFRLLRLDWRTLLSALLIVISFPPWGLYPLIWICLLPWFAALRRARNTADALIQGLWLSVLMSVGGFYWVASVLKQFGGLPWPVAIVGLILFSLIGQPQFPIFAAVRHLVLSRSRRSQLILATGLALFYA